MDRRHTRGGLEVALVVQKYGGSSVQDADRIKRVAERIVRTGKDGNDVVVVASAMGDTTDELLELAAAVSPARHARELDMLLSAGERISIALLSMAILDLGRDAVSFTGEQAGIVTDTAHGKARILDVRSTRVQEALAGGKIAIVAGFQGVTGDAQATTLGRGGSDTTAVALAAALNADVCEIYSDVDGVFTADPRVVPKARKLDHVSSEEMLELAANGAKVLYIRAVEYARRHGVLIHARSTFSSAEGTYVLNDHHRSRYLEQGVPMEEPIVAGVATDLSQAKITVTGVPDVPGKAAEIFKIIAKSGANVDMIVQNVSAAATSRTDISFTLPKSDAATALRALAAEQPEVGFENLVHDDQIGKLSVVGAGMRTHSGVSATLFEALSIAGINIEMISTSEIRISVVVRGDDLAAAARVVHTAYGLDGDADAVVHAGTGR